MVREYFRCAACGAYLKDTKATIRHDNRSHGGSRVTYVPERLWNYPSDERSVLNYRRIHHLPPDVRVPHDSYTAQENNRLWQARLRRD